MHLLSADFGTTSLKLAVLDGRLRPLASRRIEYGYEVKGSLEVEIAPQVILRSFLDGLGSFSDFLPRIDALGFCVMCPSLVPMDRTGKPLHPIITHLDRRSVEQAARACEEVGREKFLSINGNIPFPGGISLTSVLWLKEKRPSIYKRTFRFGHLNTYLHRFFTGAFVIDPTNASFTGLYETLEWGGWSRELCGALGIDPGKLPEIRPSMSVVGGLSGEAARLTGLREGIPVIMGANDTSSAAYGAGVTESGSMLNVSGSNEILTIAADRPIPHERVYLRTHVVEGKWLVLAITVGGGALEWFRREFYRELDSSAFYDGYLPDFVSRRWRGKKGGGGLPEGRAGHFDAPAGGLLFRPYLAGDRHSLEQKRASFENITLESTREDFLAALLTGIFEPIRLALSLYEDKLPLKREIVLTGGLASESWLELKRRLFPRHLFRHVEECPTIGNGKMMLEALSGRAAG